MHRWVHVVEIPLIGWELAVGVHKPEHRCNRCQVLKAQGSIWKGYLKHAKNVPCEALAGVAASPAIDQICTDVEKGPTVARQSSRRDQGDEPQLLLASLHSHIRLARAFTRPSQTEHRPMPAEDSGMPNPQCRSILEHIPKLQGPDPSSIPGIFPLVLQAAG